MENDIMFLKNLLNTHNHLADEINEEHKRHYMFSKGCLQKIIKMNIDLISFVRTETFFSKTEINNLEEEFKEWSQQIDQYSIKDMNQIPITYQGCVLFFQKLFNKIVNVKKIDEGLLTNDEKTNDLPPQYLN